MSTFLNSFVALAEVINMGTQDKKQKVLVVDDEPRNVRILEEILSDTTDLRSASTGEEAIQILAEFLPDLILLDIMMPGIDGYETCRQIRANPAFAQTRVILISGKAMVEERIKGYDLGADDYVTKPFVPDELFAKVRVYLKLTDTERKLNKLNAELEEKVRIRSEQLLRTEKAAFLGAHTAEIVHNLNNPLSILAGNLAIIERMHPDEERVKKALSALQKMNDIIKSILRSSREANDETLQPVQLNDVLKNELKLLESEHSFKYNVKLILDLGSLPIIQGRPSHFGQSFGNLVKNAMEAMHGRDLQELRVCSRQDHDDILIELTDTGSGIEPEDMARIFDPFFTTKPLEAKGDEPTGTGLGLPSVKRMIESYGGTIEFQSAVDKGTRVTLRIPIRQNTQSQAIPAASKQKKRFQPAPIPGNEEARLSALYQYQILDTISEQLFDDLTFLASAICQTPISAISLVDRDRQWFKAAVGLGNVRQTGRDEAFCAHVVTGKTPIVVEDALLDERFAENPLVTGEPNIRFYAGAPLITPEGQTIGTMCVIDRTARKLSPQQLACLQAIGRQVVAHMEWRKNVLSMTNSRRLVALGKASGGVADQLGMPLALAVGQLSRLKSEIENGLQDIEQMTQGLDQAKTVVGRIAEVIKNLREFSALDPDMPAKTEDLRACLSQAAHLCQSYFDQVGIQLSLPKESTAIPIECNIREISHLFFELLSQAARNTQKANEKWVRVQMTDHGDFAEIEILDSGASADAKQGPSLETSQMIASVHGGAVEVDRASALNRVVVKLNKNRGATGVDGRAA